MHNYSNGTSIAASDTLRTQDELLPSFAPESAARNGKSAINGARPRGAQHRLIARVAQLYHEQHLTQEEIANQLRFSQGTVCRLLQKAEQHGVVRVTVTPPAGTFVDLEELLERKFGLVQVMIARAASEAEETVQTALGAAAAHFLETIVKSREVIGVDAESATIRSTAEQMHPVWKVADCQVVQLLGGTGESATAKNLQYLVTQLADRLQGEALYLPAPGVVDSNEAAAILAQDPHLRQTVALFNRVTLALVGIDGLEPSPQRTSTGKSVQRKTSTC
jgi:DNA-binding transcriptional regulator LsrR (DeoR family)